MHITSLPSPHGVGTMGKDAFEFVDFLQAAGQSCWQVLPLGQTGFGDSPYQSCSTFAGNPYLIDPELLREEGLLTGEEILAAETGCPETDIDFAGLYAKRYPMLRKAMDRFGKTESPEYRKFCEDEKLWLEDYALFMALKNEHHGASWDQWEPGLRLRKKSALTEAKERLAEECEFWRRLQYFFFRQWKALREYAGEHGIEIIGDIPIYVAYDSADVWAAPQLFCLDEEGRPIDVAGCPPDAFSADGQLWGNPLFRWDVMKQDGYSWWIRRMASCLRLYDLVRIDHFRGFESYYAIPFGDRTAKNGRWRKGPAMDLFRAMEKALGKLPVIAEDLGYLTPEVRKFRTESGFPGMKVLQFAFGGGPGNEYLPWHHVPDCVMYTGTHDNDTILGWWESCSREMRRQIREVIPMRRDSEIGRAMMRTAMASTANLTILTMQDILELDGSARMNLPSTTGMNWRWRMAPGVLTEAAEKKLYALTARYDRLSAAERERIEAEEKEREEQEEALRAAERDGDVEEIKAME